MFIATCGGHDLQARGPPGSKQAAAGAAEGVFIKGGGPWPLVPPMRRRYGTWTAKEWGKKVKQLQHGAAVKRPAQTAMCGGI